MSGIVLDEHFHEHVVVERLRLLGGLRQLLGTVDRLRHAHDLTGRDLGLVDHSASEIELTRLDRSLDVAEHVLRRRRLLDPLGLLVGEHPALREERGLFEFGLQLGDALAVLSQFAPLPPERGLVADGIAQRRLDIAFVPFEEGEDGRDRRRRR